MKPFIILGLALGVSQFAAAAQAQRQLPKAEYPNLIYKIQSNDSYRVIELEDTVRRLNGRVEELNFLLLQLQEKVRKMEEENEERFQEIEDKQSSLDGGAKRVANAPKSEENSLEKPQPSKETSSLDGQAEQTEPTKSASDLMPRALGTLTFDKDGNVIDSNAEDAGKLSGLPNLFSDGIEGGVEAAEFGATPGDVFRAGKLALDGRDYKRAQQAFGAFTKAWPEDPDVGKAKFYLGEAYFWQKEYYQAADSHLDAHNNYPEAETAPDNLLALGLALAGLNQREVACATYAEVLNQYPDAIPRLGERVKDEQAAARC